jgi:hypothetical protein
MARGQQSNHRSSGKGFSESLKRGTWASSVAQVQHDSVVATLSFTVMARRITRESFAGTISKGLGDGFARVNLCKYHEVLFHRREVKILALEIFIKGLR